MEDYQRQFIAFVLQKQVLLFGDFILKSGRPSPYFFNTGRFHHGQDLAKLGHFYVKAISQARLNFDILFGPAYKGIPLACATSMAYAAQQQHFPYAFNRKQTKHYGEGGDIIGAEISHKKILLVDDVITAGTAIRHTAKLLQPYQATLAGVVVALNRQEHGQGEPSALQAIQAQYGVPVISIINVEHIVEYLQQDHKQAKILNKIRAHLGEDNA